MKKLAIVIVLIALSMSNLVKAQQSFEIAASFTQLELKGPLRVELIPAEVYKTVVTLYGVEPNRLNWKTKGQLLTLIMRTGYLEKEGFAEIKVYYKELASISCEGATITNSESIDADKLNIETLGSKNNIQLNVNVHDLQVNTSGKSDILITGVAKWADLRAILGSRIDCMQMEISDVTAISNQGSEIYVNALDRLDAKVNSGGNVYYLGNPRLRVKSTLGGGVISVEPPAQLRQGPVIAKDITDLEDDPNGDI